jgi:uncharacterized protein YukE
MAKSGMDYDKMEALIKDIESNHATKIHNALTDNVQTIINSIRDAYSGEAAESYKLTFNNTANNIDLTMKSIITQLNNNFTAEKAAYAEQEKKMKESLAEEVPNAQQ